MGHHATKTRAMVFTAAMQRAPYVEQASFIGMDAGTMTVGIYFDPHLENFAMSTAELGNGLCSLQVIDDQFEIASRAP
jgi:hypothetical protein